MAEAAFVLVALLMGLVGGLLLYSAVRSEGSDRETMDRADAERVARRDTDEDRSGRRR